MTRQTRPTFTASAPRASTRVARKLALPALAATAGLLLMMGQTASAGIVPTVGLGKWIGSISVGEPAYCPKNFQRVCAAILGSVQKPVDQSGSRHCAERGAEVVLFAEGQPDPQFGLAFRRHERR